MVVPMHTENGKTDLLVEKPEKPPIEVYPDGVPQLNWWAWGMFYGWTVFLLGMLIGKALSSWTKF